MSNEEENARKLIELYNKSENPEKFMYDFLKKNRDLENYKFSDRDFENIIKPAYEVLIKDLKINYELADFFDFYHFPSTDNLCDFEIEKNCNAFIKKLFLQDIENCRKNGNLVDFIWDYFERSHMKHMNILYERNSKYLNYDDECGTWPIQSSIRKLLTDKEKKEVELLDRTLNEKNFNDYLIYLAGKSKSSLEYARLLRLIEKLVIPDFENLIKKEKLKKSLIKYGSIAGAALILILIGSLCIHRAITKDARLAKKEAQRIEKIKVTNAKNVAKNQANDLAHLEKLGSAKLKMQDILVSTSEPSMYIIAPMSYDTKKFVEDNSHDKGLFGTKDNSVERLTILESCITDFQNSVDSKTGVSFLDRSKISQIEKEHKFQLGDWSNDKKTAEVGKALNANILLFLDKFGFIDNGSGEYRFEAKFVDVNTMQSASYNVVYQNAKKKVVTPGVVQTISFRDFTPVSTKKNPFADEFELKTLKGFRTVQKNDLKEVSPLGQVTKVELSEFDTKAPVTDLFNASSIYFDGFGSVEFTYADKKENSTYTFDAIEMNLERIGNLFFTDGKIGTLTVKTDSGYKKYDVFTENNREYYILLDSATLEKATVHYYLQLVKQ